MHNNFYDPAIPEKGKQLAENVPAIQGHIIMRNARISGPAIRPMIIKSMLDYAPIY
jgi:hypothetical protein